MQQVLESYLPPAWEPIISAITMPLRWIPLWQEFVVSWSMFGDSLIGDAVRRVFFLLPALLIVLGVWVTVGSLYTIPFRAQRSRYVMTLALSWWDAARCIWLFWTGIARLVVAVVGWIVSGALLVLRMAYHLVRSLARPPLAALQWTSLRSFESGVPWIAFLLTLAWSAVEAAVFTYALVPVVGAVFESATGLPLSGFLLAPVLWAVLCVLIAGSFASLQVLMQALESRHKSRIAQMLFVQFFVLSFEVVFLYSALVGAILPFVTATEAGIVLGPATTLLLGTLGWVGVRGLTWFLFGKHGAPAVVAVLSRETVTPAEAAALVEPRPSAFRDAVFALQAEAGWFQRQARVLFELLSLPVLQLLAGAVNFVAVFVRSDPVFRLPFRNIEQVLATTPFTADRPLIRRPGAAPRLEGETAESTSRAERVAGYVA